MVILEQFATEPHPCLYLPSEEAELAYYYVARLEPAEYETLMNQGYRKFGPMLFRPVCAACDACRPIRIPSERFHPDRSQRRALKSNADLEVEIGTPAVDEERLDLWHRYHAAQESRKGWPEQERSADEYAFSFVYNPIPAVEISVRQEGVLRAVVLTDVTPNVVSGVYHYHDPDAADRSLGTFCMLQTIELARRLQKRWAYFGFYVAGCSSMEYKARFRPCEILETDGVWRELT
jgi:leucyl-tRNA---protein transferase